MILTKEVEVKLGSRNIDYYESKGYIIPRYLGIKNKLVVKRGTIIIVKIKDLPHGSHTKVDIQCDNCPKIFPKRYYEIWVQREKRENAEIDYCEECKGVPISQTQRKSTDKIRKELAEFTDCKWIGDECEYVNTSSKLTFICNNNHIFPSSLDNLKNKKRKGTCPICSFEKYHIGKGHWNWKGGITSGVMKLRNSIEYKNWRKEIFKRDDYRCQCCNERGGKLHGHHILNFSDHSDLMFDINNGITLCKRCHYKFHKKYKKHDNTREQLDEFIKTQKEGLNISKLIFKWGTMNASKSMQLLAVAHNYQEQGKKVLIFYPSTDTRGDVGTVSSRIGISKPAIRIDKNINIIVAVKSVMPDCVLVDESQFLTKQNVLDFAKVVDELNIPVICYGLLRDFKNELFEGSYNLVCYADKLEEIKTICTYCNKKATMVLRFVNNEPKYEGDQVQIGGNESYKSACRKHYFNPKLEGGINNGK